MANDFKTDLRESDVIASFLDKYFYEILKNKGIIKNYYRNTTDIEMQFRGIDILIENNSRNFSIDEKAQAHYGKNPLPTFAFEISYLNKFGQVKTGWLIDSEKTTDFWLLIWPTINSNDASFSEKDISCLELMLIKRKTLLEYLSNNNWPQEKTEQFDYCYRNYALKGHKGEPSIQIWEYFGKSESTNRRKFYWYYSTQLKEKTLNIVVRKEELKEIASSIFYVTHKELKKIK